MTTARDVMLEAIVEAGRKYGWPTGNIWPMAVDVAVAALLSASDSVRLELAAALNPWRPAPVPKDVNCYVSADGLWWRYPLPGDPPEERR